MKRIVLMALVAMIGCTSTSGMTPEEKREVYLAYLAEAEVYIEESRPIADAYVAAGKLKQADVDLVYAALEAAVPAFAAAIQKDDTVETARARARVVAAVAKLAILIAERDADTPAPPEPSK